MNNCRPNSRYTNSIIGFNNPRKKIDDYNLYIDIRNILFRAQNGICGICGKEIDIKGILDTYPTLDHTIPLSLGGKDEVGNLVLTHKRCNEYKANDIPTGCEIIWLLVVNTKLNIGPKSWY